MRTIIVGSAPSYVHPLRHGVNVILFGIVLFVIGLIAQIPILETIGVILVVVGVILALLGMAGRGVGGRRHYW